jgi:TRAP-type C4-dicarboxylate transport system substrate-binding protein
MLTEQEQVWLQEAATAATDHQRILWQQAEEEALEAVKAAGVTVTKPDKALFAEKTKNLKEAYRNDSEKYQLIQDIQNAE